MNSACRVLIFGASLVSSAALAGFENFEKFEGSFLAAKCSSPQSPSTLTGDCKTIEFRLKLKILAVDEIEISKEDNHGNIFETHHLVASTSPDGKTIAYFQSYDRWNKAGFPVARWVEESGVGGGIKCDGRATQSMRQHKFTKSEEAYPYKSDILYDNKQFSWKCGVSKGVYGDQWVLIRD